MSDSRRHCEEETCFAHTKNDLCDCLDIAYDSYIICPFYKTMKQLSREIKELKVKNKITKD